MNIKEAIIKYQKELEKVQVILEKLEKAQGLAVLGATPETGLEELICKRYLQIGKIDAVLKEVNATGCRKNGEAYKSTDISDVIKAKKVEGVNPELHEAAKLLLKINKGKL
jgi:hypothetical protein